MKVRYLFIGAVALLLVGAGCANNTADTDKDTTPPAKDANGSMSDTDNTDDTTAAAGDITLSAEAKGNQEVYFEWDTADEENYDGFIIVRSEEADPVHTGNNYWFRQDKRREFVTWVDLPTGEWNFRICGLDGDECAVYSNNVTVTVE